MNRLNLCLLLAGCANKEVMRETSNVKPECHIVKGKMPPPIAGAATARGVLMLAPTVVGRRIYVGLDYSTQDGTRKTAAIGALEPQAQETRFFCQAPTPSDTAFWKFVFAAEPQDDCGYLAEVISAREQEVEIRCKPEARQTWEAYRETFHIEAMPELESGDNSLESDSVLPE